jgi:hypothetical protein
MSVKRHVAVSAAAVGAAVVLGGVAYPLVFRRRCLTWGARKDEITAKLPGDDLLPDAGMVATRAITVDAPPDAIWPWLVQMGSGRGGAYTYDWIENMFGMNMHSAKEVLPQFQDIKAGQDIPMGDGNSMRVEVLDPGRALVWRSADKRWVWSFDLVQDDGGPTRLISRNRIATGALSPVAQLGYMLFMEPGSLLMERKMLLGIKKRAEALAATRQA